MVYLVVFSAAVPSPSHATTPHWQRGKSCPHGSAEPSVVAAIVQEILSLRSILIEAPSPYRMLLVGKTEP